VPLEVFIAAILAADTELRDGTIDFYQGTLRTHIRGTKMGLTPVGKLTVAALRDYWGQLEIGTGARRNVYQLLSKAFNQLYREGIHPVPLHRKANLKSPSKKRRKEIQPLDMPMVELLAEHAARAGDALAIRIAAYAGLRAGEVGGLRVQDVDFRRRTFSIRQATWRVNGQRGVGPVKTPQSQRTITAPDFLIEAVRDYLAGNPPASDGRILHRGDRPVEHIILNKVSHDAARRAGLPPVTFHSLRHTCAALLIKSGAQPKQIQPYMGHSSIGVTMDVYGHLFDATGEDLGPDDGASGGGIVQGILAPRAVALALTAQ